MLNSIRLINWRSHADSKLDFRGGTNLLVGIMGSGKSSVLEAISFALFGTFPALERRKLKMEDVIRAGKPETKIALEFGWNGTHYKVERTIERKKKGTSSDAEIFKDNKAVENGTTAVTQYIENLTSLDYDLFTRAIYSEQNNIDYFLNLDPRRRKQEIDTLLGLDKFEDARSNIVTVSGRMRSKRQGLEERFSKEKLQETEEKEKKQRDDLSALEQNLKKTDEEFQKCNIALKGLSEAYEAIRKEKEKYESLDRELIRLGGQQESLKKDVQEKPFDEPVYADKKKQLEALAQEKAGVASAVKSADETVSKISKEAGSLEAKLKTGKEAKERSESSKKQLVGLLAGKTAEALSSEQTKLESDLLSMESERKSLERELSEISELMEKLKPGLSECPLCSSRLSEDGIAHIKEEKEALVKSKKERIELLAKQAQETRKNAQELKETVRKASSLAEKISSLEKEFVDLEAVSTARKQTEEQLSKAAAEKKSAQEKLDKIAESAEKLRLELAALENTKKKTEELGRLEKKRSELREKLKSVKFDAKTFEEQQKKTQDCRIERERISSKRKSSEEQLAMGRELLKMLEKELSELRTLSEDIKHYSTLEEQILIYKNALLETQTYLRGTLIDAINSAMNEVWPIFYPYQNYHALRLAVTEKDYLFEVNSGTEWKSLESMASGGERATAALTLRVALAMVLTPKLSWLILDEPTHNLDGSAVEMLSHALQFKVPEVVKQTFVITHEEGLMGSDFASSYRLTRDKQHDGETKIELA